MVAAAKPVHGQTVVASRINALLDGSRLCTDDAPSVQDALSFRVAPQVLGAFREVVDFAADAVEGELAAMDDNPSSDDGPDDNGHHGGGDDSGHGGSDG